MLPFITSNKTNRVLTQPERFRKIRKRLGLTQKEMADKLKLRSRESYTNYEHREQRIDAEMLRILQKELNVNPDWLLFEEGELLLSDQSNKSSIDITNPESTDKALDLILELKQQIDDFRKKNENLEQEKSDLLKKIHKLEGN